MDDRKLQEFRVDYAHKMKTKSKYMEHVELMDRYKAYKEKFIDSYDKVETYGDILKKEYKFIRDDEEDDEDSIAKAYYDKLFKEYCLADMSQYKQGKIGLRWRVEKEVVEGKGQFICGNKACNERSDLKSYEVNFAYKEHGEMKNALVKLKVCPSCMKKMKKSKKRQRRE